MMNINARRPFSAIVLVAAGVTLVGCTGNASERAAKGIRRNPAPEMKTLALRPADSKNDFAIMLNENRRMMREDFNRLMLINRQSRLSPYPIPR